MFLVLTLDWIVDCGLGGGSSHRWWWWISIPGSWDFDDEEELEMM